MFQNVIGRLKQLNLLTPSALVFALVFLLSLIIIIGQFFHQTLQNEMAEQFNKQQLLLARRGYEDMERQRHRQRQVPHED